MAVPSVLYKLTFGNYFQKDVTCILMRHGTFCKQARTNIYVYAMLQHRRIVTRTILIAQKIHIENSLNF